MRRTVPPVEVLVFVVGAASLGAEIAAARLLAPWFGASTVVWANTIAVVLVALSVGYWLGGRLADRRPRPAGLSGLVLAAGGLLAAVPFVATPFLRVSVDAFQNLSIGAFAGSLLAVLALVAVPVLLLGAASPYALRLSVARVEESGRVAGRLYAISTAGSLIGTFSAALVLIPLLGTRRTFGAFALALAVVGALGLRRHFAVVPLALAAILALPPGSVKASGSDRVLYEADTEYQYARVLEAPDGQRRLELNEGQAIHSLYRPGSYLTGDYWDDFLVLPWTVRPRPPAAVAILGNAGGTTARAFGGFFAATRVDGVEIDSELTRIGRRFFALRGPHLRLITADARPFLASTSRRYDAIVVDAYRQPYIPFYLTTREFFALCRSHLTPGGSVIVNVGHPTGSTALERVLSATMRAVFPVVLRDPVEPTNTLILGAAGPASSQRLAHAAPRLPAALRSLGVAVAGRLAPALPGGSVFTDDRAPVEWLIDSSILRYAEGE